MARRIITLEEQEARLVKLCREWGVERLALPPNSGRRRTPSKRTLLKTIEDICRRQGRDPPFKAAF